MRGFDFACDENNERFDNGPIRRSLGAFWYHMHRGGTVNTKGGMAFAHLEIIHDDQTLNRFSSSSSSSQAAEAANRFLSI
jgi:hypothetical protein